ncbi:hypothetical protein [Microcella sp.]|uniref:hypothetical protein n=1 Tax=Microcella sp. TaxID=1913979 RepID=UPI002565D6B3|nr:hypothetical protein [Microcella sp.]MBX9472987.1 hypothetical protein [Microcella sp.]
MSPALRRFPRASVTLTASGIALAALLAPAAVASAAPVVYPAVVDEGITAVSAFPNYELEVDCDAFLAQYDIDELGFYAELYHVPGGSLTITFDCELLGDDFDVSDLADVDSPSSIGVNPSDGSTVVTIEPNTDFSVNWPEDEGYFEVEYYLTASLDNPGGSLLHELDASHAGSSGPIANFATGEDGPVYDCVDDGAKPYVTQVFTVLTAGTYTFRVTGYTPYEGGLYYDYTPTGDGTPPNPWGTYNPFSDPALVLYSTFDPANTDAGFIDCNDDSEAIDTLIDEEFDYAGGARDSQNRFLDEYFSELIVDLEPGTYTLVTIPYDENDVPDIPLDDADTKFDSAFVIDDLGPMTTQAEIWGQPGGLVLGAQLAATGAATTGAFGLAAIAALLLVLGVVGVVVRRRTA